MHETVLMPERANGSGGMVYLLEVVSNDWPLNRKRDIYI